MLADRTLVIAGMILLSLVILATLASLKEKPCPVCGRMVPETELMDRTRGVCDKGHFRVYRQALERERVGHVSDGVLYTDAVMCDKEMERESAE